MNGQFGASKSLVIVSSGAVTSVGQTAGTSCAAIRANLSNPTTGLFNDAAGDPLITHTVHLERGWRGRRKLAQMAAMAVDECLESIGARVSADTSLLLCVAESSRAGRFVGLDHTLLDNVQQLLGRSFAKGSGVIALGRVSIAVALRRARELLYAEGRPAVVIAATDSLLTWPTLQVFERQDRLLTARNSNGFIAGEASAALCVTRPDGNPGLHIDGVGMSREVATVDSDEPLLGVGLAQAISTALADADAGMSDVDFRVADMSGEQYYFKEAALALSRTLRTRKETFDLWHPAECVGETGAAIGPLMIAVTEAACRKEYAPGHTVLCHAANDTGERMAVVARYRTN